jgi:prepilin-type N-terminal cleavage/methylation domain-containing protein
MSELKTKNYKLKAGHGYTIIELLVTIGIFSLISSIVLVNYPKLSEQLSISQTAHEIALAFREAKTYALAVRQYCPPGGGACSYNVGYGVHFDTVNSPQNFILYVAPLTATNACATANCMYSTGYEVDTLMIKSGISIARICDLSTAPPYDCKFNKLDVAYARPDPAVYITGFYTGGSQALSNAGVVVRTPGGNEKTINVWTTGQISVQ